MGSNVRNKQKAIARHRAPKGFTQLANANLWLAIAMAMVVSLAMATAMARAMARQQKAMPTTRPPKLGLN